MTIKVIIAGFKGKMGSTAVEMVKGDAELSLAALVDPFATETEVDGVPVFKTKEEVASLEADVWVDFTTPKFAYENTRFALENGFAPVAEFDGFRIHSVRLPGLVAHQEVIFGAQGEGLTIRHDSYDRISFMGGVNLGIKEVVKRSQLVYGLEHLL
ncbi:dihydrodipicolinate reductase C-terminal domain-containing protein [Streptococcus suis]